MTGEHAATNGALVEISIILPLRNEVATVDAALDAALGQILDATFEVIAVDGASDDGTRERLEQRVAREPRLRVVDNPARGTPHALNAGLAAARGTYWMRLDGHSELPTDYVQVLVSHLRSGRAEAAAGVVQGLGHTPFGRAVAAVHDSRFGIGNARHHYAKEAVYVDHATHGIYHVDRSLAIGGFDESLVRNQDYDFDFRYRRTGARILVDPSVVVRRHVRETPVLLARQFHEYGFWKCVVLRRHPETFHLRWLAPPALAAGLGLGAVFSQHRAGRRLLVVIGAGYIPVVALGAITTGRRAGPRLVARAALAMITMHLAWGSGFLRSLVTPAPSPAIGERVEKESLELPDRLP